MNNAKLHISVLLSVGLCLLTSNKCLAQCLFIEQSRNEGPYIKQPFNISILRTDTDPTRKLSLVIPGANIRQIEKGVYNVSVDSPGIYWVQVFRGKRKLYVVPVRVRDWPLPVARIARWTGGEIQAPQFRVQDGIIAEPEHLMEWNGRYFVINQFRVIRLSKNGHREEGINQGAQFKDTVRAIINRGQPDDVFVFYDILGRSLVANQDSLRLPDMVFRLK